jgi:hypothetical protein
MSVTSSIYIYIYIYVLKVEGVVERGQESREWEIDDDYWLGGDN